MKNILPGTAPLPKIDVSFAGLHISRRTLLRMVEYVNRFLTGRRGISF